MCFIASPLSLGCLSDADSEECPQKSLGDWCILATLRCKTDVIALI